jgi:hypothetical protein
MILHIGPWGLPKAIGFYVGLMFHKSNEIGEGKSYQPLANYSAIHRSSAELPSNCHLRLPDLQVHGSCSHVTADQRLSVQQKDQESVYTKGSECSGGDRSSVGEDVDPG